MTTDVTAPARTIRAGFVGGGFMATVHSRAARAARAELIGGASSSADRARDAAQRLGFATAFASFDELLADPDIDVVHVCTPNATHAAFALAALEAGKHVICEKPLATTATDAAALAALADERGLVAAVPFVYRFHPMAREARARIARGETGRLLSVQGSYLQDWLAAPHDDDWRVDAALGGPSRAFADIGSHLVDLLEFVAGERITRLSAKTSTVYEARAMHDDIATEDLVAVVVELASGAVGTLLVSQVAPGHKNGLTIELAGTDASVRFEQERPDTLWLGRTDASSVIERDPARLAPDAARLSLVPAGHPMGYQDAFNAFIADAYAAIGGAAPEGLPRFDDGLRAVRVTEAVLASAASGSWVEVAS
ncbi:putative dehydrogenase [Agromyces cerinus]|nr:Gfo/Idh/MocA family oxidoreductase [Agromyces cerinus]MBM7831837.1 putative dehydrogenase [Agromyces cerinus]